MGKILELRELISELKPIRNHKTIGLVTGRFDLLHTGHISFLRFAKSKVDILIVGVDQDISIKRTMPHKCPIHPQEDRLKVLSELRSIDYVFPLQNPCSFNTKATNSYLQKITKLVNPNYLLTSKQGDVYWEFKKQRIESIGGELILYEDVNENSMQSQLINVLYN